jgi:hypothetical protein
MSEPYVCIVDVLRDGKRTHLVVKACNTNSVLKCLLSEEQEDVRQRMQIGLRVRLRIMTLEFARSEPLIRVRVLSPLEEQASALGPREPLEVPLVTGPVDGVCGPGSRKRIFFDLLQDAL